MEKPGKVYKYLAPTRVDVLENSSIRASQVAILNDPFEVNPDYSDFESHLLLQFELFLAERDVALSALVPYLKYPRRKPGRDLVAQAKSASDELSERIREKAALMICLSEKNNNLLMWSHYAQSYSGFVLGFDTSHPFFAGPVAGGRNVSKLFPVTYSTNRPRYPSPSISLTVGQMEAILLTKSADWAYESEWRMLVKKEACSNAGKIGEFDCYLLHWPPELLSEIILGPLMEPDTKARILTTAKSRYQDAKIYEAKLSRTRFDLEIVSLPIG